MFNSNALSCPPPRRDDLVDRVLGVWNSKCNLCKKLAFTLAEVLITLGIIGVVAALTMPNLIENHKKKTVAVQLQKFYSIMSQAVLRYESEQGITPEEFTFDEAYIKNNDGFKIWYNETIGQYIQNTSQEKDSSEYKVAFNDGSGFTGYIASTTTAHFFYCTKYKYCASENFDGQRTFLFSLYNGKFITSSPNMENYTRDQLLDFCLKGNYDGPTISKEKGRHACTRLIQYDGWQILNDYPWKYVAPEN